MSNGVGEDRKELRRERIAATARELFAARGFDAVSVAEVATAAGVTEKTVFNHFATKEDLVYSSDRIFEEQLVGAVRGRAAGASVHHAVTTFLLARYTGFPVDPARRRRHQMLSQMVSVSPTLQARERLILSRYAESLRAEIAAEQDAAPNDLRPRLAAEALMAAHGAVIAAFRRYVLAACAPEVFGAEVVCSAEQIFQALADGLGDYATKPSH